MPQKYSQRTRLRMVQRMVGPNAVSAGYLAAETGIAQSTLSRWLRAAGTVSSMTKEQRRSEGGSKPPQEWTAEERLRVVLEAFELSEEDRGVFLRERGLHEAQLDAWRDAALRALQPDGVRKRRKRSPRDKEVRQLRAELQRKDKALAETAALLVLQGKARALWGEEGASTAPKTDKKRSR